MAEKSLNTRIVHKHDIEANWLLAVNFVPKKGEIIVYDADEVTTYPRMKIGNGSDTIGTLPFVNASNNSSNGSNENINLDNYFKKTGDYITGPIGLTLDVNYGLNLPEEYEEGQLFFMEETSSGLPEGGIQGQIIVKNSSADGDASWQDFPTLNYLPATGTAVSAAKLSNTSAIGSSTKPVYFNASGVPVACGSSLGVDITGSSASCTGNAATATTATNATNIYSSASTSKAYILGTTTASSANHATVYNASVYTSGSVLYGAAWNDYAEYRICNEEFIPGQVVCENGDDTLSVSIKRMQPGANVISDTFGFAIGETENAKCPIAVSGRVLAYTYEPREEFKPGEAVCAGPNGTVSKMTRAEIREYPERIIGTVSAVPNYEYWGEGQIKVNNRIWIKI